MSTLFFVGDGCEVYEYEIARYIRPTVDSEGPLKIGDRSTMVCSNGTMLNIMVVNWSESLTEREKEEFGEVCLWWAEIRTRTEFPEFPEIVKAFGF